jgi:hypothetical protein
MSKRNGLVRHPGRGESVNERTAMGCCGKKLADELPEPEPASRPKSRVRKIKSIVAGNWNLALRQLKAVPDEKSKHYHQRLQTCRACDLHTWLTWAEFYRYVNDHGGLMKFMKEIASLEQWPLLPKQEYESRRKLFCRVCKCFLMAKAAIEDEVCPFNKWENPDIKESQNG